MGGLCSAVSPGVEGSSQGYKMAGYDVIGCNEIDPRQMEIYKHNLKPKYSHNKVFSVSLKITPPRLSISFL